MYENKKILILGGARSGLAIARLLSGYNNDMTISDLKPFSSEEENELKELGVKVVISDNQGDLIDDSFDLIIKNPAIMYTNLIIKKIEDLGIRLENEMEVAYHFLPEDVMIIGVTGSNGKTTVTTMIYELLKRSGKRVILGGNIGFPLAQVVREVKTGDILLLEISDHQLVDFRDFKTNISVLTNVCPTHLDYHGTYEHYKMTKKKIFNRHSKNDLAIINQNNEDSLDITKDIVAKKLYFGNDINFYNEEGIFINGDLIVRRDDILLQGNHNFENILAALLVLNEFGIDKEVVRKFLMEFGGVEHRLEFVADIKGVKFYNDSKATNPTATITALKTFHCPIHLILGGQERNQDFNELNDDMKWVKHIYAIGTVTKRVKEYADKRNIACDECFDLERAIEKIKGNMVNGDAVLLSTASASQDFYVKFEDRGNEFKNLVAKIK